MCASLTLYLCIELYPLSTSQEVFQSFRLLEAVAIHRGADMIQSCFVKR